MSSENTFIDTIDTSNQAQMIQRLNFALELWENGDNNLSDIVCGSLLPRKVPKPFRAWANLLIAMNATSPFLFKNAQEAVKLFREIAEPGNIIHQKQLELAENILEFVADDLARYAEEHRGVHYMSTDDTEEDELEWEILRLFIPWAVAKSLNIPVAQQLSNQFLAGFEATS